ncbi:serine hydrolase [Hymenobacter sp.]|uniref:serine hydrolase n=1 Tax=Hymenobacter sp. TaxID=1898978 RepID=UPI002ED8BEA6
MLSFNVGAQTGIPVSEFRQFEVALQRFMQRWEILGASVAFGKDDRLVYARSFGYADQARTEPLQPYHLLRVASLSKPVTAMAVLKLVEQGRINLAGKAFGPQGYLQSPYYTSVITDQRVYDITVQQLLEHSAGWDRLVGCDGYGSCDPVDFPLHVAQKLKVPSPVGDSAMVRFLLAKRLNFTPGTRYAYSNIGYLVLGKIVEAVTGQGYETWVHNNLLVPAGALEAHLGHDLASGKLEREAEYQSQYQTLACNGSGQTVPAAYGGFHLEAMSAHGGWVCSARDLVRLVQAVEGGPDHPGLLTPSTLATLARPSAASPGYAKGWQVNRFGNRWHGGRLDGTATYLVRTAGGYTWAILLNTCPSTPAFWQELDQLGWVAVPTAAGWPSHNLSAPLQNATALTATKDSASVLLRWTHGTGNRRLVLMRADGPVDVFPTDGVRYTAAPFGQGEPLGHGTYVVADETADSLSIRNLDPRHSYHIRVVEYADNTVTSNQPLYTLDGNPTLVLEPAGALALDVYPNPAHEDLAVAGASFALPYEVMSQDGLRVTGGQMTPGQTIPVVNLQPGTYFIRFQAPEGIVSRRFVKE